MLTIFRPHALNLCEYPAREDLVLLWQILLESLHRLLPQFGVTITYHCLQPLIPLLVFLIELLRQYFGISCGLNDLLGDHVTFLGWPLKLDDSRFVKCSWIWSTRFLHRPITFCSIRDNWLKYFFSSLRFCSINCRALNYILKVDFDLEILVVLRCFKMFLVERGNGFITSERLRNLLLLRFGIMITDE